LDSSNLVDSQQSGFTSSMSSISSWQIVSSPIARIAAIDNGLSFPFKHPDQWRSYPFGWSWLPCTKVPFSEETRTNFLPKLSDQKFVDDLCFELKKIAMIDADFDEKLFNKQMALLRGQLQNLIEALEMRQSPYELIRKPLIVIYPIDEPHEHGSPESVITSLDHVEQNINGSNEKDHEANDEDYQFYQRRTAGDRNRKSTIKQKWKKILIQVKPLFSWC
jgi:hypothetical protein